MRNASPLILALILAATAIFLSIRGKVDQTADANPKPSPAQAAAENLAPPKNTSDIPADPSAVFGTLDNGLDYVILPNSEPPNRVSIRLHIAAGSLMESEDQRGLAHFLEHMVFNGTKRFKDANQLIRQMQTRGIAFGAHVNAYTSFDETVYMLDLPDLKDDTMDLCFGIMRDFGDGALLSEEEIDAERGVILSEKRSRDSVGYRMMQKQFDTLLPGSLIPKRFPIGVEEVIENAPRERFQDFYSKYYVPQRMTFVVVGNIDAAEIQERIKDTFGSMENPESPGSKPDLGTITVPAGTEAHVFSDPELDSTDLSLLLVRPYAKQPDTIATRSAKLPISIANFILDRRFERISKQENSPISSGSASKSVLFNELELGSISAVAADDRWQEALPVLEQEFRRAIEHGFTEAELAEAKANILNSYREAVKRKESRKSEALATAIAGAVNDGTVFSTPETDLKLTEKALDGITTGMVHDSFVAFWKAPGYHLVLSTKQAPGDGTESLSSIYRESAATDVTPPAEREIVPFAYTDFGKPGTISETTQVEDLDITQLVLSNNIRVNLKKTEFEKNRIRMFARIGSGKLSQPGDKPMLDAFAQSIYDGGGLGKHSNDELSEILAGRNVSVGMGIGEDAFTLSGTTTPDDQLLQLQLMVASLTDPGYRTEALWQFQKAIPVLFQNLKHTPSGPSKEMDAWLHGGDFRYTLPTQVQLSGYTIDEVKSWLTPELEKGYLELSIVGDFDREQLIADLLATIGTLPERSAAPAAETTNPRTIAFPEAPAEKSFSYESKIPQAVATGIWKTDGMRGNIPEFRRLNVLSDIFGDRLREEIREKLGASYSPNAGASGDDALDGFGYLIAQAVGKPDDIPLLLSTMESIAAELAENGATADELSRALAPTLSSLEKTLRDNSYWLGTVLSQSQADPGRLDLARSRDADYRSITLEEINAIAKKYFQKENLIKASILPKE
ncbi:insulinase family protein [Akkermansiaceae bacterium]|nr:insulinase family protein [Akkermansiaceae bacterium]